ncbi:MAG: ABC transporter substrate-binding protein [Alphaproteobacteria bacterium]|nr:ABC transporter substrate-binding protein [Alphaproteobacteria bacterium]MDX5369542.1 ABC transporter substrate-binding protein [Alphaproteobacteria bacterium]MDX5464200.1 ABC transporter substrate-binding protein [Alphaproteobacteria bacterium]
MKYKCAIVAGAMLAMASGPLSAAEYVMSASADYSGPFADVMPNAMSGINAIADWWNAEVGKDLGVTVQVKIYDMRYDASVIARTWPAILSSDKPILHLGFGSPDLVTLMKRLPNDKVPMLIGTAMVGLVWAPDGWHYSIRPTYSHEFAGLMSDLQEKKGGKLKIGAVSTQKSAGFVDQVKGVQKLAEMYPDRFEVLEVQWVEASPVSVTNNIRAMLDGQPDVILVGGTTAQVIATAQALEELGADVPIISSTHNGLSEVAKGIDLAKMEGSFSAFSFAPPARDGLPIRDVYEKHKKDGNWGLITAQSAAQALLALRVLEHAVKTVGADNVTGEAMRAALLDRVYTEEELLGALPSVDFDTTAPFPIGEIKATAEVVEGGKIVPYGEGWMPVPPLEKW